MAAVPMHRARRPVRPRARLRVLCALVLPTMLFGAVQSVNTAPSSAGPVPAAASVEAVLPTVQIDGVAWSQAIIGNIDYVGGSFGYARPAGALPGTQLIRRTSVLAYDLRTGRLVSSFAPVLNGVVRTVTASADGKFVYIGGDFTTVNGQRHARIARIDATTGRPTASWRPQVNGRVESIVAGAGAVYISGGFSAVDQAERRNVAALDPASGALTPWKATVDGSVDTMVLAPDNRRIILGGSFTQVNKRSAYGMAALSTSTAEVLPWRATATIRDAGKHAGITSLSTDGHSIFGTAFVFGGGGNLEGAFSLNPVSGAVNWIADCHGDTYSSHAARGVLYVVGHTHSCSTLGSFDETVPRTWRRGLAFTLTATGRLGTNTTRGYANFAGDPRPSVLNWFPNLTPGTVTGLYQAAWNISGNANYLAIAGEFPDVNGVPQQGLARMAY